MPYPWFEFPLLHTGHFGVLYPLWCSDSCFLVTCFFFPPSEKLLVVGCSLFPCHPYSPVCHRLIFYLYFQLVFYLYLRQPFYLYLQLAFCPYHRLGGFLMNTLCHFLCRSSCPICPSISIDTDRLAGLSDFFQDPYSYLYFCMMNLDIRRPFCDFFTQGFSIELFHPPLFYSLFCRLFVVFHRLLIFRLFGVCHGVLGSDFVTLISRARHLLR